MRLTKRWIYAGALALSLLAGGPGSVARADADGEKKQEKDLDDAEKRQGQGGQQPGPGGQQPGGGVFENPLEKILKLMEEVEGRLFESDTGKFTQDEQKKIIEAMRFEQKSHKALEELIDKVQQQQDQQQSQSQSQDKNQQQQKNQKNQSQQDKKNQQRSKQQQERDKREEQKRQAQKDQQNKTEEQRKKEEEERKKQEQQQKQNQQQDQKTAQQKREGRPPNEANGELGPDGGAAGRWGTLPSKLHQDAANARNRPTPSRWSRLINRYRERLAGSKDN
ncbi:MAG: hypothetical protein AB7N76_26010 [Planctomycetota bacterium]